MVRQFMGKLHLWLGLTSGLVVFIVALTGSILAFEEELDLLFNRHLLVVDTISPHRKSLDELQGIATRQVAGAPIQRVQIFHDADRSILFLTGDKQEGRTVIALNPYTGQVLGVFDYEKRFFTIVLKLHRYLLMGETGKVITGINCLIFLIMLISGLVIWWPRVKAAVKQRFRIKWNGAPKRLNWDIHAVGGFYALIFLLAIAFTGLVWSFSWVNKMVFLLADGKPQKKEEFKSRKVAGAVQQTGLLEHVFTNITRQYPFQGDVQITLPAKKEGAVNASIERRDIRLDNIVSNMYFDRYSGQVLKVKPYESESRGMKIRRLFYPVHTGSAYGWPTKLLAMLVALFAASLPVTGTIIWLGRKKKGTGKKSTAVKGEKIVMNV
ncbi:PepSY domain-containing protein [Chitinophaga pendula]|uniref:PepSY-associated TM helix domain-containing protein n=1 Tax=Chitinophaga TaxID=79328 RepID=UPI000BAEB431|nr:MULTISPECIES: PepSY-associated TM helix domain-containing protein [Chitinophaga]ASZ09678.1 peptidase [Chitinophaga sp. MD30]UCJ07382.1 PepSY domain-containing protein [Chitinophaga pendula]